jgi:hypothetical protein
MAHVQQQEICRAPLAAAGGIPPGNDGFLIAVKDKNDDLGHRAAYLHEYVGNLEDGDILEMRNVGQRFVKYGVFPGTAATFRPSSDGVKDHSLEFAAIGAFGLRRYPMRTFEGAKVVVIPAPSGS